MTSSIDPSKPEHINPQTLDVRNNFLHAKNEILALQAVIGTVVGPTGPAGTNGAAGAAGPTGPAGTNGAAGPTGPAGTNGAAGPTGPAGTNGTNGTNGAAGTNGTNGAAGTNGTNGATGPTGPAGTFSFAGQIAFPAVQNPSADPNTLDDYEEGSWTPTVGGTSTYLVQYGEYVKIGLLVYISMRILISSVGTGSGYIIQGLPFINSSNTFASGLSIGTFNLLSMSVVSLFAYAQSSSDQIILQHIAFSGNSAQINSLLNNGTSISISGNYYRH